MNSAKILLRAATRTGGLTHAAAQSTSGCRAAEYRPRHVGRHVGRHDRRHANRIGGRRRPGRPARPAYAADVRAPGHLRRSDNDTEVAEIVASTQDGRTLLDTDYDTGQVGFVDITDPVRPQAAGTVPVEGSPTSVAVAGRYALVASDTSASFDAPSGELAVLDIARREIVRTVELGGQPDAVRVSPDGRFAAVVLENQRDEDVNDGLIPQLPAGSLVVVRLAGAPAAWSLTGVDLTELADIAPNDPEPEYVDINQQNLAVVSLQENNHFALVDLPSASVVGDFPAGSVDLVDVDATEDDDIQLVEDIARRREPDSVAWVDRDTFVSANEGDYTDADGVEGGSRGWTLFASDGSVEADAGNTFDYAAVRAGHYPEGRSENKGSEAEAAAVGTFAGRTLMFIGAERGNNLQVLDVTTGPPRFVQLLPTGIGPEGVATIGHRGLVAVANETSEGTIPSMITVYGQRKGAPAYPQLASADDPAGRPVPWVAQSGLTGDLDDPNTLWSVSDSILSVGYTYRIALSGSGGTITERFPVTGASTDLDLEGIADAPEGGFWLASEGNANGTRPNVLLRVNAAFAVQQEVPLPAALVAAGITGNGFEGVAVEPTPDGSGTRFVYAVIQAPWWGSDVGRTVKIGRYEVASGQWTFVSYALDAVESPIGGTVGLSEVTRLPDGSFAIIERDNRSGTDARVKRVYGVNLAGADFRAFGQALAPVAKTLIADLLDELAANSVWTPDKLEGLSVTADGRVHVVTDNDGLDDAVGQTVFLSLGPVAQALAGR